MKKVLKLFLGVGACALIVACSTGDEALGDKAYEKAKKASGHERRTQLKLAYTKYNDAFENNKDNVSDHLRRRYIEMAITRVQMMLDEGGLMDAIPLIMKDIDARFTPEVPDSLRQRYAEFIVQLGDSSKAKGRSAEAFNYYNSAIEKAADPAPFIAMRNTIIKDMAQANFEDAQREFELGKENNNDSERLIRAEYFAKVALHFDSTHTEAQKLLSEVRKLNRGSYSAFVSVINSYSDTAVFKKINNLDILLAVPDYKVMGGRAVAIVHMYNYSNRHLRLNSDHFFLEDVNGQRYKAEPMKIDPVVLEYEKQAKNTMRFPVPRAPVRKLVYDCGDCGKRSEKFFF